MVFDNAVGAQLVRNGYGSWSKVPTASVGAYVAGNFAKKGLPNINESNVGLIIGKSNGRGIYVIFDTNGHILQDYLGAPDGVLGVSSPQYSIEGTTIITESWTVLNGSVIDPKDVGAAAFQGVATHEFGHSLGLAHTQVNGAAVFYGDAPGPASCAALPYAVGPTRADVETMYPYIDPTPGTGTGVAQGNVHTLDSMAGISDLYPGTRLAAGLRNDRRQGLRSRRQDRTHRRQCHRAKYLEPLRGREFGGHRSADPGSARARRQLRHSWVGARQPVRPLCGCDHGRRISDAAAVVPARSPRSSTATRTATRRDGPIQTDAPATTRAPIRPSPRRRESPPRSS